MSEKIDMRESKLKIGQIAELLTSRGDDTGKYVIITKINTAKMKKRIKFEQEPFSYDVISIKWGKIVEIKNLTFWDLRCMSKENARFDLNGVITELQSCQRYIEPEHFRKQMVKASNRIKRFEQLLQYYNQYIIDFNNLSKMEQMKTILKEMKK